MCITVMQLQSRNSDEWKRLGLERDTLKKQREMAQLSMMHISIEKLKIINDCKQPRVIKSSPLEPFVSVTPCRFSLIYGVIVCS